MHSSLGLVCALGLSAALGCSSSLSSNGPDGAAEASFPGADGGDGGGLPDSGEAGVAPEAGPDCSYPAVANDPHCPSTYSGLGAQARPCSPVGLACAYPGAGDGTSSGCATAMMWCRVDGGDGDAGATGMGSWVVAQ
ncbi:MAG TPA: hypothetical protein VKU41_22720 [Polyangiaceae bacterium]|nr:hypothetical protein [Polyangiaceae bacterium]